MKRSRFTDSQIIAILKPAEAGVPVPELFRENGISSVSFFRKRWQKSGEAIRPEADGAVCSRTPREYYPSGLSALCRQRILLPLQALTESGKSTDC